MTYETLLPGEEIVIRMDVPVEKGGMTPEQLEKYLRYLGKHATRAISARGTETGRMTLVAFKDHGPTKDVIFEKSDEIVKQEIEEVLGRPLESLPGEKAKRVADFEVPPKVEFEDSQSSEDAV